MNELDEIAPNYNTVLNNKINRKINECTYRTLKRYLDEFDSGNVLEIGCADGRVTQHLITHNINLTCVDGSEKLLQLTKEKFPSITAVNSMLEDWETEQKFDFIICSFVLEHVDNVGKFLGKIKSLCHEKTQIFVAVPNAWSFHRKAALAAGMITKIDEFSELDKKMGHKRYYNPMTFRTDMLLAGFYLLAGGGILFKPLPESDMANLRDETLEAFYLLGKDYPEHCNITYVVAKAGD
jgi:2-polyprenyl-3-methyl-5-hydroxy-6-metoxy-1,4-benzoquinol methylase